MYIRAKRKEKLFFITLPPHCNVRFFVIFISIFLKFPIIFSIFPVLSSLKKINILKKLGRSVKIFRNYKNVESIFGYEISQHFLKISYNFFASSTFFEVSKKLIFWKNRKDLKKCWGIKKMLNQFLALKFLKIFVKFSIIFSHLPCSLMETCFNQLYFGIISLLCTTTFAWNTGFYASHNFASNVRSNPHPWVLGTAKSTRISGNGSLVYLSYLLYQIVCMQLQQHNVYKNYIMEIISDNKWESKGTARVSYHLMQNLIAVTIKLRESINSVNKILISTLYSYTGISCKYSFP